MIGFPRTAQNTGAVSKLLGAQLVDSWRWRLLTSAGVMSVTWASSLSMAWLAWRPTDPRDAAATGLLTLAVAVSAILLGKLSACNTDTSIRRSDSAPYLPESVTGRPEVIDALAARRPVSAALCCSIDKRVMTPFSKRAS